MKSSFNEFNKFLFVPDLQLFKWENACKQTDRRKDGQALPSALSPGFAKATWPKIGRQFKIQFTKPKLTKHEDSSL